MELNDTLSWQIKARIFVSKPDTSRYRSEAGRLVALIRILRLDDFQSYEEKAETNDYISDGVRYYLAALEKIEP